MEKFPHLVIEEKVEGSADSLRELSHEIWRKPELSHQETSAHDLLTDFLGKRGFSVERRYKLPTAFRATYSQGDAGGAHVLVICEYDALPRIGHACGHNLIAEAGVAAGLGLRAALEASSEVSGTVTVLGTPAEESGGGKIDLIEQGAFDGVDAAFMAHPDKENMMSPRVLAYNSCTVTFSGRAAHAAAAPWEGVNALDAAISAYTSLSMLRQQVKPDCRLHAVLPEGGTRPNIIPEKTVLKFIVRAPLDKDVGPLKQRASDIMTAAAMATGCSVDICYACPDKPAHYSNLVSNTDLISRFQSHWQGFKPSEPTVVADDGWASTDMGNVSYVVPSIHPTFSIGTSASIHTREFATAAITPEAHAATRCAAKAMACVGWDVLTNPDFRQQVKDTFKTQVADLQ